MLSLTVKYPKINLITPIKITNSLINTRKNFIMFEYKQILDKNLIKPTKQFSYIRQ